MANRNLQALSQYQQVGVETSLTEASPHEVIRLLMEGALERIVRSKGALDRGDVVLKAKLLPQAVRIIEGLSVHLDRERGGELADNLDALYSYMIGKLVEANAFNDAAVLDEVVGLLGEIKAGWDAIAPERSGEKQT